MTTFSDQIFQFGGAPVGAIQSVMLGGGNWYFCDPTHGKDSFDGTSPQTAKKTLLAAYTLTRDGYNDGVIYLGGATADTPLVAFTWSNNYCHLIGATNGLPGMGQRARLVNSSTYNLATLITFSGSGCLVANMQFFDGKNSAADGQCVVVSGSRNHFVNCFFAGMGDTTASGPFSRAGSFSLKASGSENTFTKCFIGLDTVSRTAANAELVITAERNKFVDCTILCQSVTAGKFLVSVDNSGGDMRDTEFENCLFRCYTPNWATGITDAFHLPSSGATYSVLLDANCRLAGVGMTWADTVTHLYGVGAVPAAGFGIAINPTS